MGNVTALQNLSVHKSSLAKQVTPMLNYIYIFIYMYYVLSGRHLLTDCIRLLQQRHTVLSEIYNYL